MGALSCRSAGCQNRALMSRYCADVSESAGKIHLSFRLERDSGPPPHRRADHIGGKITERSFPEAASSNIMAYGQIRLN
jgi:hypothetical protein